MAAKKANNNGAVEKATFFVNTALDLLNYEKDIWNGPMYSSAFDLLMIKGSCAYSISVDSAISIFNNAIQQSNNRLHLYEACYYLIMAYLSQGKFEKVFEVLKNQNP